MAQHLTNQDMYSHNNFYMTGIYKTHTIVTCIYTYIYIIIYTQILYDHRYQHTYILIPHHI